MIYQPLNPQAQTMARVAAKRKAAADLARKIVKEYVPSPCGCEHCGEGRHIRADFAKIARELNDPNGMSEFTLWVAYGELERLKSTQTQTQGEHNE